MIVLCYDEDTSQMAAAILRARDYTAFSVSGGFLALSEIAASRRQSRDEV